VIILGHEQGSDEWLADRLGVPSASMFSKLITSTGKPSSSADGYINTLGAERVTGKSTPYFVSEAMNTGTEREPEARAAYEFLTDHHVSQVGFVLHDSREYGCSPDGLVEDSLTGEEGGLEIKCPQQDTQFGYLRDHQSGVKKYYQQIQGCMMVTDRKWWDFFSYHPGMDHVLVRVERNDEYIAKMREQVLLAVATIKIQLEK